ncbi:MAG: c-type cytochrome domain-containing protein, partial [Flavitalea sp.]
MQRKKIFITFSFAIFMMVWVACMDGSDQLDLPEKVSYNFHIRPILSDKCFKCHGPDVAQMQAGLRLDAPEFAYAPLKESKGKFAIIPGKP